MDCGLFTQHDLKALQVCADFLALVSLNQTFEWFAGYNSSLQTVVNLLFILCVRVSVWRRKLFVQGFLFSCGFKMI